TNSIDTWLEAGYRPSRLVHAWDAITASFQRNFPDKTFNVPIIPVATRNDQKPFPEIDEDGLVFADHVPPRGPNVARVDPDTRTPEKRRHLKAVLSNLLQLAAGRFPGHLIVEFENLTIAEPASPTVVDAAETFGTMTGFMTNNFFAPFRSTGGAACSGGF